MAARAKVCGLTRPADVDAAVDAGADAVGFVVDVPVSTPREITAERAAEFAERVPPFVTTVAVTFPGGAATLIERTEVDAVQLHGDPEPEDLTALRAETGASVLMAVDAADHDAARRYDGVADALVVDSTDAAGAGGTGRTHDWTATRDLAAELDTPVVLAGGLDPDNVADAVRTAEPYAVDVASGVEREGGVKDHDAVRAFVERAAAPEVVA